MKKLILLAHLLYFSSNIFGQQYVWTIAPFDASSINLNGAAFESNGTLWGSSLEDANPFHPSAQTSHIGKYDGNNLTIYTPSNTNYGLPVGGYKVIIDTQNNKYISSNAYGSQGNLTYDTLCVFNGSTWTKSEIASGEVKMLPVDFLIDNNNTKVFVRMIFDSQNSNALTLDVYKSNNNNWMRYTKIFPSALDYPTRNPIIDSNNNLWISDFTNLYKLDTLGNWTSYPIVNFGVTNNIGAETMQADNNGNIWLAFNGNGGNGSGGIVKFNGTNWVRYNNLNSGLLFTQFNDLEFDGSGNLWIAGNNINPGSYGLQKFDGQNWGPLVQFMGGSISKMIFAPNGYLWIQSIYIAYTDFSTTTSNDNSIQSALKIYPNPTLGNLSIEHPNVSEFESIEIYDVYGRSITVPHTFTHSTMELETQSLPAGYYTLSIKTPKGILRNSWIKQ